MVMKKVTPAKKRLPSAKVVAAVSTRADSRSAPCDKSAHFCDLERDLPIAGTPAPKPCPFCGVTDVAIKFNSEHPLALVQCQNCGVEGPYGRSEDDDSYGRALEAARLWNERNGVAGI